MPFPLIAPMPFPLIAPMPFPPPTLAFRLWQLFESFWQLFEKKITLTALSLVLFSSVRTG